MNPIFQLLISNTNYGDVQTLIMKLVEGLVNNDSELLKIDDNYNQSMSDRRSFFRDRIAIGDRHLAKRSQCDRRSQNQ